MVCAGLLCTLASLPGDDAALRFDLPQGFTASVYATGIDGARDLSVRTDGTLTLRGGDGRFEIAPSTADEPVTVMRVAVELDDPSAAERAALAVQAPRIVRMRWDAGSGELGYRLRGAADSIIPVPPQTLALARVLAHRSAADVALAPDGSLFVADAHAGAVWRIRPIAL